MSSSGLCIAAFKLLFLNALNKFAPVRKKKFHASHSRFVDKELSKPLMHRTKLNKKILKEKTTQARLAHNKKNNTCVAGLHKSKGAYFENLDIKNLSDNKKLGDSVKPLFSNKVRSDVQITLCENDPLLEMNTK